ncbi:hypothetical protein KL905_001204 [Ogataea polymorpha]|uniref:Prefoldin subunit 4 n=1 Tax=Ogataea polymorpha TaxID=460523 RepID=A0A1B7SL67_9ASCO|nr:uncharacterized protein OGAPODRAFT_85506 [Ogataea polymorpha]KAG7877938.1 hypothetical protein KL937_004451 [Ogataea polymorpha]KAG7892800.1 hypothetical protein KL936_000974 [Ogataea polymorpha]KAG7896797.1 hypothetical protein KL908_000199 [Ogataea polymorpha]KAG7903400.1 hypothetical protein KL935_000932 [Ogataea polymorpha]KAG7911995.1 hypothetical protein KL906_000199 [Ogataea polymorpha]
MELLPEGQKNTTEVTWQDQQKINSFSTLISKKDALSATLDEHKQEKEYLDDLALEIELVDEDEKLNYKIGDSFVLMKQSEIVERLENDQELLDSKIGELESQIEDIDQELNNLKKLLYAKFGNAINLER